jgi:calmodulin-lysine N-methyltransferase
MSCSGRLGLLLCTSSRLRSLKPAEVGLNGSTEQAHRGAAHRILPRSITWAVWAAIVPSHKNSHLEPDPQKEGGASLLSPSRVHASRAPMESSSPPPSSSPAPAPAQATARSHGASNASQRWSILRRSLIARSSSSRAPGLADSFPLFSPMSTFASASF